MNVIMHAPNAYQIYCRVRITDFSLWTMRQSVLLIEVFTDGPSVFTQSFDIEKLYEFKTPIHDFTLLTQAKGMYLSMRSAGES